MCYNVIYKSLLGVYFDYGVFRFRLELLNFKIIVWMMIWFTFTFYELSNILCNYILEKEGILTPYGSNINVKNSNLKICLHCWEKNIFHISLVNLFCLLLYVRLWSLMFELCEEIVNLNFLFAYFFFSSKLKSFNVNIEINYK